MASRGNQNSTVPKSATSFTRPWSMFSMFQIKDERKGRGTGWKEKLAF
jgi:hypothetical protein